MRCEYCDEAICDSLLVRCGTCGCAVHDYCESDDGWCRSPEGERLCASCAEDMAREAVARRDGGQK